MVSNVNIKHLFSIAAASAVALSLTGTVSANSEWHWERSTLPYTGEVYLGTPQEGSWYSRYDGASAPLFGAASVMSPLAVVAGSGSSIDIGLYHAGRQVEKTTTCSADTEWKVYLAITSMCLDGAYNIAGVRTWADEDGDQWTPQMAIFSPGWGWMRATEEVDCAVLEAKQVCQEP